MRPLSARFRRLPQVACALPWPVWAASAGGVLLLCAGFAVWALVATWQAPAGRPPSTAAEEAAPLAIGPTDAGAAEPTPEPEALAADSPFAGIAEPAPPPPNRTEITEHRVEAGEVLWQIAERYGLRPETLVWTNDLDDPDLLLIGQKLLIVPEDGVLYTVQPGDRLADVARRYGVDLDSVVRVNKLASRDALLAETEIFLPGARPLLRADHAGGQPDTSQAPPSADQEAAGVLPPVALPAHITDLLAAGWLRTERETVLYRTPDRNARRLHALPPGVALERAEGFTGGRIQVRDPGDGRSRQAMTGWVDAFDLAVGRALAPRELPVAYPESTAMDIAHVFAPYRSQLDGSPYAEANCGPVTIGMALETFGISVPSRQLRAEVLNAQGIWGHNVGTLMTALADVVEAHGLRVHDLYARGGGLYRWSLDDIREHLAQGHAVVVQVRYRSLPGRGGAYYYGDHYILLTGVLGSGFIYNDPIDIDGIGWDRVISGERLRVAMDASDRRYAYAAFAVSR